MSYISKYGKKIKKPRHLMKKKLGKRKITRCGLIVALLIFISISSIPTYAYFTKNVVPNLSLNGGNNLKIVNGYTDLSLNNDAGTAWTNVAPATPKVSANTITDPSSAQEISYGPVYIMTPQSSLGSNIDIQTEYTLKKSGGTAETANNSSGSTIADPFEVIVGDADNFNFGTAIDFYSGSSTTVHDIGVFPQKYDAQGTDRRMAPSGFYQLGTQIFTKVDGVNAQNGLKLAVSNASITPHTSPDYDTIRLTSSKTVDGVTVSNYMMIYGDGYTNRGLSGKNQANTAEVSDCVMDGVNWKYLQRAKPMTFKYDTIPSDKSINSVTFQIFTDDLQSGSATNQTNFPTVSSSYFRVYLSKLNAVGKIEIPEFAEILNKYAQSGPIGNMVSLNLPEKYLSILKSASGLNEGLELLIDDTRIGTTGDSFAIDFAKMTVNKEAAKGSGNAITVSGKVIDSSSAAISGVKVSTGDGKSAITAVDGTYTISGAAPGILSLSFSHYKYRYDTFMYGKTIGTTANVTDPQILYRGLKSEIPALEKLRVRFTIQKCDLSGNPIAGENPIILDSTSLNASSDYKIINVNDVGTTVLHSQILKNVSPGSRYKLTYKLILKSYADIGDVAPFNLLFSSRIKAKLTQENNPSWNENGTGSGYLTSVTEPSGGTIVSGGGTPDSLYSEIYFERPDTAGYWTGFPTTLPSFYLDNMTTALTNSGNISTFTNGSDWYKYTFSNKTSIGPNSKIKVNGAGTSGELYYFSTQKVFICTN